MVVDFEKLQRRIELLEAAVAGLQRKKTAKPAVAAAKAAPKRKVAKRY